ncbi:hypothetical protein BH20ACT18_BH20ACT18_07090 [soil metagenome]
MPDIRETSELPAACSLSPSELADRRAVWRRLAASALRDQRPAPGGVRLVYADDDGVEATLRELVRLEADCCAFADWVVERRGETVVLDVTAPGDGAEAIRTMFASA